MALLQSDLLMTTNCSLSAKHKRWSARLTDNTLAYQSGKVEMTQIGAVALLGKERVLLGGKAGEGHLLKNWSLDDRDRAAIAQEGHTVAINGLAFVPDGSLAVSVAPDGLRLWDAVPVSRKSPDFPEMPPVRSLQSLDGTIRVTVKDDNSTIRVVVRGGDDLGTDEYERGHEGRPVIGVGLDESRRLFVRFGGTVARRQCTIVIWDAISGVLVYEKREE